MDSACLTLALLLATTACFLYFNIGKQKHQNLPPGPYAWPLLGSLLSIRLPLHRYFLKLSKKYGPVIYIKMGAMQVVCVNDVKSCNEFLNLQDLDFCYRTKSTAFEKFFSYNGLMGSPTNSQLWSTLKKVSVKHLFSVSSLNASEAHRVNEMKRRVKEIYHGCQGGAVNLVNLRTLSSDYLRNVVSLTMFSEVDHEVYTLFERAVKCVEDAVLGGEVFPLLSRLGWTKADKLLDELMPKLKAGIIQQINKHRARKDVAGDSFRPVDFVDALICLPSEYDVTEISMVALVLEMFAGAIETSQALVENTMAKLINHPEVMQKAQDEIDRVVGRSQWVQESPGVPYIKAIVKEVLRLDNPIPLGGAHINHKESTLGGYTIPAGCNVFANLWALGNDPKHWKDADRFMPERFLAEDISLSGQYPGYMPFSRGRRSCPGTPLAMRLVPLAVSTLIQGFYWKPPPGRANIDLTQETQRVLRPAAEIVAVATPRLPHHMYMSPLIAV